MNCRILYSTQSGRAKACSRRVARIIATTCTASNSNNICIQLMNGNG
jgi:menaquinone-dependent protoporphyrinogen IX oxidase